MQMPYIHFPTKTSIVPAQRPMNTRPEGRMVRMLTPYLRFVAFPCSGFITPSPAFLCEIKDPSGERRDLPFTILIHSVILKFLIRSA